MGTFPDIRCLYKSNTICVGHPESEFGPFKEDAHWLHNACHGNRRCALYCFLLFDGYDERTFILRFEVTSTESMNLSVSLSFILWSFVFSVKLCYVMAVFAFLYALNWKGVIEAPVEGEEYINLTEWAGDMKPFLGALVFIGFVMFGLVYPLWTKLGCCGKCKPKVRIRNQFAVKTGNVVVTRPRYQRQQVRESSLSSDVGSGTLLLHDKRQDESISDNGTEESDQIPTRKTFSLQRMQHSMEKAASILTKTI